MKNFEEIKNNFSNFIKEVDNIIDDDFGKRLQENELNEFLQNIEILDIYEKETNLQINQIKTLLFEAKSILPIGF